MNVKETYFDFLAKQGAKQKIKTIIESGISEWKKQPAYKYVPTVNDFGDTSGEVRSLYNRTIGDIAKTDMEVLRSYTGDSEATHASGCGLSWLRVADRISSNINDCLSTLKGQFIIDNAEELFKEYDIEHDNSWSDEDTFFAIDEAMILSSDSILHYEWMQLNFPEYVNDNFDDWHVDYFFNVRD